MTLSFRAIRFVEARLTEVATATAGGNGLLPAAILGLAGLGGLAGPSFADSYQLICENPRREYLVKYSDGEGVIQLDTSGTTTLYRVLAVEKTDERHVVVAVTREDGPTARLSFRPYLRMEYWSGNELMQTDACRTP